MFNMLKSWNMFNESDAYNKIRLDNIQKFKYSEDDYRVVSEIKKSKEKIEKEYGFVINFSRFDDMGTPFIDIEEKVEGRVNNFFATYNISSRNFSMWCVKKIEQSHSTCVWNSEYNWSDLASITTNMTFDSYYLNIKGDFFDELERIYYIYYQ